MTRKAFTLVELMVVVLIIGLLIAILLPTFASMIESTRRTTCSTNLKALFAAISLYEKDEGSYPQVAETDGPDTQAGWWLMVCRKGGPSPAELICPSDKGVKEFKGTAATDTPFPDVNDEGRIDATTSKNVNRTWSYSFQISNGGDGRGNPRAPSSNPARFAVVADRAPYSTDLKITAKTTLKEAQDELKAASAADRIKMNSPNHGGDGQNVLFRDGHVKWNGDPWGGIGDDNIYSVAAAPVSGDSEAAALTKRLQGTAPAKDSWPSADDDSVLCNINKNVPCVKPGTTTTP